MDLPQRCNWSEVVTFECTSLDLRWERTLGTGKTFGRGVGRRNRVTRTGSVMGGFEDSRNTLNWTSPTSLCGGPRLWSLVGVNEGGVRRGESSHVFGQS